MRNVVYGVNVQSICRPVDVADITIAHNVPECSQLTQKE